MGTIVTEGIAQPMGPCVDRDALEGRAIARLHPTWRDHVIEQHGAQVWAAAQPDSQVASRHYLRSVIARKMGLGPPVPVLALERVGACALGWSLGRGDEEGFRRTLEALDPRWVDAFTLHRHSSLPASEVALVAVRTLVGIQRDLDRAVRMGGLMMTSLAARSPGFAWDETSTGSTQDRSLVQECQRRMRKCRSDPALFVEAASWIRWAVDKAL